jgi:hypothetical protein
VTIEQTQAISPPLGDEGTPCTECGAPLAGDQRYCLNCGQRRTHARLPFMEVLENRFRDSGPAGQSAADPAAAAATQARHTPPVSQSRRIPGDALNWAAGATLAAVFALGIVIGALLDDGSGKVTAAPPQVISVATPAGAATAAAPAAEFTADWPEGTDGFTIQLQTLPKDGTAVTDVDAAKTAAEGKGATDVGALDSDVYSSLDSGNYVIYAGVFDKRKQASKALKKLEKKFPNARVVAVSTGGSDGAAKKKGTVDRSKLKDLQSSKTGKDQQEKSRKLPDETKLPGKAPPKDKKKPGGGSGGGQVIE